MKVSTADRVASMQRQIQELHAALDSERAFRANVEEHALAVRNALVELRKRPVDKFTDWRDEIGKIIQGPNAMFTESHYILVAKIIKDSRVSARTSDFPAVALEQIAELQLAFIKKFEADNPKFNKLLFIGACGETGDTK